MCQFFDAPPHHRRQHRCHVNALALLLRVRAYSDLPRRGTAAKGKQVPARREARVALFTSVWRTVCLTASVVVALMTIGIAGCSRVDRESYVRENERLFRQLPLYPGAKVVNETSTPYREEESGPVVGYGTRFDMTLPAGTSVASVSSFYRRRLRARWRLLEALDGPVFNYRRDRATLSVNLENHRIDAFEVAVDHAFFEESGH